MSLSFGKTKAKNFGRIFKDNPKLLTRNAYLNFLRSYKAEHPDCGVKRVLQRGAKKWAKLTPEQQEQFTKNKLLPTVLANRKPVCNHHTLPKCKPLGYTKRSMNAEKNVRNSWRKAKHLPPKKGRKNPKVLRKGKRTADSTDGMGDIWFDNLASFCVDEEDLNKKLGIDDDSDDDDVRRDTLMDVVLSGDDDIDDDHDQGNGQSGHKGNDQPGDDDGNDYDEIDDEEYIYIVPK